MSREGMATNDFLNHEGADDVGLEPSDRALETLQEELDAIEQLQCEAPLRSGKTETLRESWAELVNERTIEDVISEGLLQGLNRANPLTAEMLEKTKQDLEAFRPEPASPLIFFDEATAFQPTHWDDALRYSLMQAYRPRRVFVGHPDSPPTVEHHVDRINITKGLS